MLFIDEEVNGGWIQRRYWAAICSFMVISTFYTYTGKFAMQSYILLKFKHMILISQFYNTYIQ